MGASVFGEVAFASEAAPVASGPLSLFALGLWVVGCTVIELGSHVLITVLLLRAVGTTPDWRSAYHVLMVSQCANALTPFRAGIPIRIYLYRQRFGTALSVGTAMVFVEGLVVIAVPAVVAAACSFVFFAEHGVLTPVVILLFLGGCTLLPWLVPAFELTPDTGWRRAVNRFAGFLQRVRGAVAKIPLSVIGVTAALVLCSLLAQAARLDAVLAYFGQAPGVIASLAGFTISFTAGTVTMIPLGLGVRDGALALLLAELGVGAGAIATALIAQRVFAPGMYIVLGMLSAMALGLRRLPRGVADFTQEMTDDSASGEPDHLRANDLRPNDVRTDERAHGGPKEPSEHAVKR